MAQVFAARPLDDEELVAVKVLRADCCADQTAVKLLQREARAGLGVGHPHLVRVREAHVTRPPYYLVMDLLPGESLRQRLRREYLLDPVVALWVARQTAEALACLHRKGFIHGDIKPDNVRLVDAGTAVLVDLGFAHRPGENASLLQQGYVLGTANYLAPELCTAEAEDDPRADVFSLGVTLFESLTGSLPYPTGSVPATLARHRDEDPARLEDYPGQWPPALCHLVDRLMARRPSDRPRAAAVVQELIALEIATLGHRQSA
jgi:serine/threonine protein kinase